MEPAAIFISRRIQSYVDERFDGNVNRACYHMKIKNYTAVYRLYHGDSRSVNFFLASRILKHTDPDKYFQLLAGFFPDEAEEVLSIKTDVGNDVIEEVEDKFALVMSSKTHFAIFARSLDHDGISLHDIAVDFGKEGPQVASELRSAGVVKLNNGVLHGCFADKNIRPSLEILKQHANLHVELIDDREGFRMENPYGGLNILGVKKVFGLLDKVAPEILEVYRDSKYQGAIMYLVTLLGGVMAHPRTGGQDQ